MFHTVSPSTVTTPACCSKATHCAAMPAARKAISALVTAKRCRAGMVTSPKKVSALKARRQQPENAADQHARRGSAAGCGDAIEEEHHLRAFPEHGDRDHDGQRGKRADARRDRRADTAEFGDKRAPVLRHPAVVPGEHRYRDGEDRGIEEFLPHAGERVGDRLGESRDEHGADDAGRDPR